MHVDTTSTRNVTLAAFSGAVIIGGTNFIAVKFSNEDLAPLFGAAVRFAAAAAILLSITALYRLPLPRGSAATGAAVYGLLGFGFAYGLMYFALVGLGAGVVSVIAAAVPLATLVLAVLHGQERFTTRGVVGGLLAIAGLVILAVPSLNSDIRPAYLLAAVLAVIAIAESSVVVKGFPRAHPVTTNAVGMSVGAIFLVIASLVFREAWALPEQGQTWLVLAWLVVVGSVGLFALFLFVIKRWTASATVYALTLMPVVAVTLGAVLADEDITPEVITGGVLVMLAVYVGALRPTDRPPAPTDLSSLPGERMLRRRNWRGNR